MSVSTSLKRFSIHTGYLRRPTAACGHFHSVQYRGRKSASDEAYLNHLSYSLGSHGEVETLFEIVRRRKLVPDPLLDKGVVLIEPIGKMLHGLVESLELRVNAQHS